MTTSKKRSRRPMPRVKTASRDAETALVEMMGPLTMASMLESARMGDESSQSSFARRLGISRANLCDIEKGRKLVSPQRAAAFAEKLAKSVHLWVQVALEDELRAAGLHFRVKVEAA